MRFPIGVCVQFGPQHGTVISMHLAPPTPLLDAQRLQRRSVRARCIQSPQVQKSRRPMRLIQLRQQPAPRRHLRTPPDQRSAKKAMLVHPVRDARQRQAAMTRRHCHWQQSDQLTPRLRLDDPHARVGQMVQRRAQHVRCVKGVGFRRLRRQCGPAGALRGAIGTGAAGQGMRCHVHATAHKLQ